MKTFILFFVGAVAYAQVPTISGSTQFKDTRTSINTALTYLDSYKPSVTKGSSLPATCTPSVGVAPLLFLRTSDFKLFYCSSTNTWDEITSTGASGSGVWGSITGTLSDQADLTNALAGKSAVGHGHAQADVTGLSASLAAKESTSNKGVANGYASLDSSGLVPVAQIPPGAGTSWGGITGTLS